MRNEEKKKKIYIIISYTGTIMSKVVRIWTHKKYSHASISLDRDLEQMYSFGRVYPYYPFIGSFVHESPKWGTFKRFKKTKCIIISLDVTDKQYNKAKEEIDVFIKNGQKHYRFNDRGVVYAAFNKRKKQNNKYYCSEFVKHILDTAGINNNLPEIIKPMDFIKLDNYDVVYEGYLKDYNS